MKPLCSIFILFMLLLLLGLNEMEARRTPEEYWKHVMGDEPIPEAIGELLVNNQEGKDPTHLINRDFDTKSVAIIYHHHDHGDHHHHHQVDNHGDKAS